MRIGGEEAEWGGYVLKGAEENVKSNKTECLTAFAPYLNPFVFLVFPLRLIFF